MIGTAEICDNYLGTIQILGSQFQSFGGSDLLSAEIETIEAYDRVQLEQMLKEDGKKRVLFIDAGNTSYALLDKFIVELAINNNWRGLVLNGCVRHSKALKAMPIAIWGLGTCPLKSDVVTECVARKSVELNFQNLKIESGMHLYADEDGVIVTDAKAIKNDFEFNLSLDYCGV